MNFSFPSVICGLTDETTSDQLVRAALEAVCFQTRDILDAMNADCNSNITQLLVDGGMTANNFMMQSQADLSGIPVSKYPVFHDFLLPTWEKLTGSFYNKMAIRKMRGSYLLPAPFTFS